jgi:hypothetical protein
VFNAKRPPMPRRPPNQLTAITDFIVNLQLEAVHQKDINTLLSLN